jgi:hypothetical protein
MTRKESRNPGFVKRIPVDLLGKVRGQGFTVKLGENALRITVSDRANFTKFSLEIK